MIKTTIIALIEGRRYEFTAELAEVAGWADTANETAIGMLHDSMDQLSKAIEWDAVPDPVTAGEHVDWPILRGCSDGRHLDCFRPEVCGCGCHRPAPHLSMDANGNRQCYLCGFYHDEPGSCATGEPTNIAAGPDEEPEYDGPTDDNSDRFLPTYDDGVLVCPECGAIGPALCERDCPRWNGPEEGDYRESTFPTLDEILETGRPYDDDECAAVNGPYADRVAAAVVEASKQDEGDR